MLDFGQCFVCVVNLVLVRADFLANVEDLPHKVFLFHLLEELEARVEAFCLIFLFLDLPDARNRF